MIELNKKSYNVFIDNIQAYIDNLSFKIKEKKDSTFIMNFDFKTIADVESYFTSLEKMNEDDILEFWAFFGNAVMNYLGGEWKLASKSEDVAFTPIIINYGYKKKWNIRVSPEVWRDKLVTRKLLFPITQIIENMNNEYGK